MSGTIRTGAVAFAMALLVTLSVASSGAVAAGPITAGATFNDVPNLGVTGSHTYMYTPSVLLNPAPMLTPVVFVYSDTGYASKDAAWDALSNLGVDAIAEAEHAVLIVQTPVAGTWGASDVTVYQGILQYIYGANTAASGKPALSYYRLNYMLGEGAGATFINQYMTQSPNVNRIAGVATFGGTMPAVPTASALPAYIVGGSQQAVDYFKAANATDAHTAAGDTFYNSANSAKKVIVSSSKATSFSKPLIKDAYDSLFRYTARQGLSTALWDNQATPEDLTLMERPNVGALDLSLTLGAPVSFGAFAVGVAADYNAGTTATVISTAGDATLSVADPSPVATGHLVNGAFSLPSPLLAASSPLPAIVKSYAGPVSNDAAAIPFTQHIGANDALRTGAYSKTLTFTLSTTTP